MQSLSWYLNRLRRMTPGELLHRSARAGRQMASRAFRLGNRVEPVRWPGRWPKPWFETATGVDADVCRSAAERILAGRYSIFDLHEAELSRPPAWNRDPLTGRLAPLQHASALDYRDERVVGNIKYLWEPNRHLHLVTLAQAFALSGERRYADELRLQLESWMAQCPYPFGPNWSSSLELGIRLINWSLAWQLLGGADSSLFRSDEGRRFRDAWLGSVFLHVRHIVQNLSRHSSANNHLIGEAAGVFIAASTWPCWPQMQKWGARSCAILEAEALNQNAPDGGNREQAVSYQQFVLDFLLLSGLTAKSAGADFSAGYWARIEAMIGFLASLMDVGGHVPMLGDADDGYVVRLDHGPAACPYRSLIATGAVLFDRPDLAAKSARFDDKSRWLLASFEGERRFRAVLDGTGAVRLPRRAFPDSGYFILGDRFETAREIRLIVDAGPLGYLKLAAHGHADALAIVLSVAGEEILIDPGTFCYHTEPEWRSYFRGTPAHNTVAVDAADQSVQRGNFMWSDHARPFEVEFDADANPQRFRGAHDGYRRLSDPVIHRREVLYDREQTAFMIVDTLDCAGPHTIARHWHFSEQVVPVVQGATSIVRTEAATVSIEPLEPPDEREIFIGSLQPPGGWVSRSFGRKVPTHTVRWQNRITGTTVLRTRIACKFH